MTLANRMSWHHALPDDVPKSCCHSQLSPSWHSLAPFYFPPHCRCLALFLYCSLFLFNANVRGSNKIANLSQSSLNGTMSQCSMFRMAERPIELPPAFLAANAYARMANTHTHTASSYSHTHTHSYNYIWRWSLAIVAAWKIIHWERHPPTNGLAIFVYVYVCVCALPI